MKNKPSKKHLYLLENAHNQIIKLESDVNYTVFYLNDGKTQLMSYSLKNYQNHFNHPFIRVNKSCIINLSYLQCFSSKCKTIQMNDGSQIRVSRRRFEEVLRNISNVN